MKTLLVIFVLSLLVITACDENDSPNPKTDTFFTGSQGVRLEILPESPPSYAYYYSPQYLTDGSENSFPIIIEVDNEGASEVKGGIYVSGFNPTFIQVEGMQINQGTWSDCWWGEIVISGDNIDFNYACSNAAIGGYADKDNWFVNVGEVARRLDVGSKSDLLNNILERTDIVVGQSNSETVQVSMSLRNWGIGNINYGRLLSTQFANVRFDVNGGIQYSLHGDRPDFPGGETDVISLDARIVEFPKGADYIDQDLLITNCYMYSTFASPQVCVDRKMGSDDRKVCHANSVRQSSSNAAPVAITIEDVTNTPVGLRFSVVARNIGGGDVFHLASLDKCNPYNPARVLPNDLDLIHVPFVAMGPQLAICSSNVIRLDHTGRGRITCDFIINTPVSSSAYETPIEVEAWYGYRETQLRNVRIKRAA